MDYVLVFCVAFFQVSCKAFNILSIVKKRYWLAFFVSMGISLSWIYGILKIVENPKLYVIPFVFGCAFGVVSSMWLEGKLFKEKDDEVEKG